MDALRPCSRLLLTLTICATFVVALIGCSTAPTSNTGNNTTPAAGNTNKTTTAATPAASPATPSGDKIGVAECDDYLAKYEACVDSKVPEAARAQLKASFETTRKSWQGLAATPQGKAGLAQACKAAHDAVKQQMAAYGCTF
ncbi:MAG: hypothetical protein DMF64_14235 [Acidobacteria bacterium]|nr:MAG: hypothetical protein DMF64_14235 [Acidobacteriota bacterium]